MSRIPECDIPEVKKKTVYKTTSHQYEVITPIFGGGAVAGKHDEVTQVRGAEIRGQLRFWWRATRGGAFNGDLKEMKKREEEIWGAASTKNNPAPSQVQIEVKVDSPGNDEKVYESRTKPVEKWKGIAYAAFPLADLLANSLGTVKVGVKFTLKLAYSARFQEDVEAALWAWEMFGGVGGRTRRGFGAVAKVGANSQIDNKTLEKRIRDGLDKHVVKGQWPVGVPHLSANLKFKVLQQGGGTIEVWEKLINKLKDFRQYRVDRHTKQKKEQGVSVWPEPKAIRKIVGLRKGAAVEKFPRAKFGLPIIFHFKDKNEPPDTTLKFREYERLASPLILRPVKLGSKAFGVALLLETKEVPFYQLVLETQSSKKLVKADLTPSEVKDITPLKGKTDVLQAFLDTL